MRDDVEAERNVSIPWMYRIPMSRTHPAPDLWSEWEDCRCSSEDVETGALRQYIDSRSVAVVEITTRRTSFCGAMRRRRIAQGCSWPKYTGSMESSVHAVDDREDGRSNCQKGI